MLNPMNLNKKELFEYTMGYCKHRMPYTQHPRCYEKEKNIPLKIGYFDIETGGKDANFDIMLCYSIKTRDKKEILSSCIKKKDFLNEIYDKRICKQLVIDLQKYDIIITYFGTRFDIPFSRSRCMLNKIDYPIFGSLKHKDVYYMVKHRLKLNRNSLQSATSFLNINGKNHVEGNLWVKAKHGDEKALSYIQKHCNKDVIILEKLHKKLEIYVKNLPKSI